VSSAAAGRARSPLPPASGSGERDLLFLRRAWLRRRQELQRSRPPLLRAADRRAQPPLLTSLSLSDLAGGGGAGGGGWWRCC
jgi:hypothetical protein